MTKSYLLSAGDFQRDNMHFLAEARAGIHRLEVETDAQFNRRVEIVVDRLKEKGRAEFDAPVFRTVIIHSKTMATITVEVIHGGRRGDGNE